MKSPAPGEATTQTAVAGTRLVRVGGIVAGLGAVIALVALLPLAFGSVKPAPVLWFLAIGGVGIGVGIALWGIVRAARARSRFMSRQV